MAEIISLEIHPNTPIFQTTSMHYDQENSNLIGIKCESKEDKEIVQQVDFLQEYRIEIQKEIVKKIVMPNYFKEIEGTFRWKKLWQRIGRGFFWSSNIFVLVSGIFNFMQVNSPNTTIFSMVAGIANICTLMLIKFGTDAKKESYLLTQDTNIQLQSIGLNSLHIPQSAENNFNSTATKPGAGNNESRLGGK
jgi:hypothetical protein